jgi:phosphatidylglycerophosphate synthase
MSNSTIEKANLASRAFFKNLVSPVVSRYRQEDPNKYPWLERNLANIVTFGRIASSGIIARGLVTARDTPTRQLYFAAACLNVASDGIDGELARGLGTVSKTGKIFDPIADKILFSTMALGLVPYFRRTDGKMPIVLSTTALISIGLEAKVLVTGARVGILSQKLSQQPPGSNAYGKIKFATQCSAVLLGWGIPNPKIAQITATSLIVAAIPFSVLSEMGHSENLAMLKEKQRLNETLSALSA